MKPQIWTGVAAELNAHAMSTLQRIAQTIEQHYLPAPCRIEPSTVANACAMWRRIACSNVAVCLTLRFWHRQPAAAADCITGLTAVERVLADSCLTNEALRQAISKSTESNEHGPASFGFWWPVLSKGSRAHCCGAGSVATRQGTPSGKRRERVVSSWKSIAVALAGSGYAQHGLLRRHSLL